MSLGISISNSHITSAALDRAIYKDVRGILLTPLGKKGLPLMKVRIIRTIEEQDTYEVERPTLPRGMSLETWAEANIDEIMQNGTCTERGVVLDCSVPDEISVEE